MKRLVNAATGTLGSLFVGLLLGTSAMAQNAASTSLKIKMTEFTMPPGYECPLFSNSPYTDMLTALDKMQDNLNKVFPQCENKAEIDKVAKTSTDLRTKIMDAQTFQKTGQVYKLNGSADSIVNLTQKLQKALETMSAVKTSSCYNSEAQFRNMIFSINDTFQSLSPLVMELVTKTPGLGKTLGPALKIFAGADAISKSLSMIEQIAKSSIQFDMTDPEQRMTTVKNICQFMKLYNRLEYLRLSRLEQVQTVHDKFRTEISEMNDQVEKLKKDPAAKIDSSISAAPAAAAALIFSGAKSAAAPVASATLTEEQITSLYNKLRESSVTEQNQIQKALSIFDSAKGEDQYPEITQCQTIRTTLYSPRLEQFRSDLDKFAIATDDRSDYRLQMDIIRAYNRDLDDAIENKNLDRCARLGSDLLKKLDQIFVTANTMIANYENKLVEKNGEEFLLKRRELETKEAAVQAAESNYANLKTMLTYVDFESSEVEKRAKGIHKYLFAGPDKVQSECSSRLENNKCSFLEGVTGVTKAYYAEYRNQGPVYELILNNENYFNDAFKKMNNAMLAIQRYEDNFVDVKNLPYVSPQIVRKKSPELAQSKQFNQAMDIREQNAFDMPHVNLQNLPKNSPNHTMICMNAKLLFEQYTVASTHMMSTKGMCEMVKNVLGQPEVSKRLREYCLRLSNTTPSGLDKLRYRLVGEYDGTTTPRQGSVTISFNRSPKAFVDQLLNKYRELGCQ